MRTLARLAASSWLATTIWLVGLAGATVMALGWIEVFIQIPDEDMTAPLFVILVGLMVLYGSLGRLLVARRPLEAVGWIFLVTPLMLGLTFGNYSIIGWAGIEAYVDLRSIDLLGPLVPMAGTVASAAFIPTILFAFPLLAIVFPDGRLPGRRWRWPMAAIFVATAVAVVCVLFGDTPPDQELPPNPLAVPGWGSFLGGLGYALTLPIILTASVMGLVSIVVRIRRGNPLERRQLAWLLAAAAIILTLLVPTLAGDNTNSPLDLVAIASLALLPLATTIAVLRYRLYEIDRIVSRTIAYAVITAVLVGVFAGAVLASQALLADVTGGDTIPVALSTLLVFALFQPLRRRVQEAVDRRFNRRRVDAQRAIDRYGRRLRDEVDLTTVRDETLGTVAHVVEPRYATLWVRG